MEDELLSLKNLGKTSTQWLHAAGIHSTADLRRLGAIRAYNAVKSRGFHASRTLLYALEGALRGRHWCELPPELKHALNQELLSLDREREEPQIDNAAK
ncbi:MULTISPECIES: TfoX/Sxy family protein [unclassified Pseudomonas]|uniref:TfoX/Sxy family protein n=1 Tax=unclassified Pseudomonas TaxID=196821 RepID=UPI000D35D0DF|nr:MULTISPECIES: TfoX/Sxy family protein [unclassified Pseudomonas]RAU41375.1 competence protein TfoX [Pseudomonas sp. RIT 409]RAU48377.1 competence protein TfoX [Pseudomonas sp. RIT 412]